MRTKEVGPLLRVEGKGTPTSFVRIRYPIKVLKVVSSLVGKHGHASTSAEATQKMEWHFATQQYEAVAGIENLSNGLPMPVPMVDKKLP